jgi:phosphopantetheinyl transferase
LRHFSNAETAALLATPAAKQRRAFYTAWVRKEAWVKALGANLGLFPFLDARPGKSRDDGYVQKANDQQSGIASAWLQDLEAGPNHSAALAVCGLPSGIRCINWFAEAAYLAGRDSCGII